METIAWPFSRQSDGRVAIWDKKFEQRRSDTYKKEDSKLEPQGGESKIALFFAQQVTKLDPLDYAYTALRDYIDGLDEHILEQETTPTPHNYPLALLDDRRDTTGWVDEQKVQHFARNWLDYESFPPPGELVRVQVLDVGKLYQELLLDVSLSIPLAQDEDSNYA